MYQTVEQCSPDPRQTASKKNGPENKDTNAIQQANAKRNAELKETVPEVEEVQTQEPMASKTNGVGETSKKGIYARRRLSVHMHDMTRCLDFFKLQMQFGLNKRGVNEGRRETTRDLVPNANDQVAEAI
jgi:hypothetical protein